MSRRKKLAIRRNGSGGEDVTMPNQFLFTWLRTVILHLKKFLMMKDANSYDSIIKLFFICLFLNKFY